MNGFSARGRADSVAGRTVASIGAGLIFSVSAVLLCGCESTQGSSMASWDPFHRDKPPEWQDGGRSTKSLAGNKGMDRREEAQLSALLSQGKKAAETGDYADARRAYQEMIVAFPDHHEGYYHLGVVADHEKRFREAEALFAQAIRLRPLDAKYHSSLGYCFLLQRKLDDAEAALLKAVALQPSNGRFRTNLGMVYGHQERYTDALEQFRRAGGVADAYCNLAFVLEAQGKTTEAKNAYQLAMRADPTSNRAERLLAELERYQKDPAAYASEAPEIDADGMRWVRYVEQAESRPDNVAALAPARQGFTPMRRAGTSVQQMRDAGRGSSLESPRPRVAEWGADTRPLYE